MDISKRILEVRESKGITQTELARKLDMEQSNYSRLEKRGDKLTFEQVERIAAALDVSLGELLGFENSPRIAELENTISKLETEIKKNKSTTTLLVLAIAFISQSLANRSLIKNPESGEDDDAHMQRIQEALKEVAENIFVSESDSK